MNVFVATLLRLSYSGGFVILGVMILRLLLRGVPKQSRLITFLFSCRLCSASYRSLSG